MQIDAITVQPMHPVPSTWLDVAIAERPPGPSSVCRERAWRQPAAAGGDLGRHASILASRWTDERTAARRERSSVDLEHYVIAIALRPVRVRLVTGGATIFDGTMPAGMIHVSEPGQSVEADFSSPCDFIHFHVAARYLRDRQNATGLHCQAGERSLRDRLFRDDLAAQLSRTLTDEFHGGEPLYAASVGQTILMRVLAWRPPAPRVGALPKWRLRRVQDHVAANIAEPITLTDLAEAAGLSRMHFAAQFRVATGCRPHDYLLQHRIECAKRMLSSTETPLVEVALSVGFQTQSHFSTVFQAPRRGYSCPLAAPPAGRVRLWNLWPARAGGGHRRWSLLPNCPPGSPIGPVTDWRCC